LEVPVAVEGVDLSPAWRGVSLPQRVLIAEATQPIGEVESVEGWVNQAKAKCVRRGRWKYVFTPYLAGREELYDLEADPGERVNLLKDPEVDAIELSVELRGELEAWAGRLSPLPSAFNSAQQEAVRSRLQALGYSGQDD